MDSAPRVTVIVSLLHFPRCPRRAEDSSQVRFSIPRTKNHRCGCASSSGVAEDAGGGIGAAARWFIFKVIEHIIE
jgi:hypothetical protein